MSEVVIQDEMQSQDQEKEVHHDVISSNMRSLGEEDIQNKKVDKEGKKPSFLGVFRTGIEQVLSNLKYIFLYSILFPNAIIITLAIIKTIAFIKRQLEIREFFVSLWAVTCNLSVLYLQISYFFVTIDNDEIKLLFQDGMYFYLSSILVFSFLSTNFFSLKECQQAEEFLLIVTTLQYQNVEEQDKRSIFLDYNFKAIDADLQVEPQLSSSYNLFSMNNNYQKLNCKQKNLINSIQYYIPPNFKNFLLLLVILIAKLFFCFSYIKIHSISLSYRNIQDMVIISFVYIYTAMNLNRILANNDLKRKSKLMEDLNEYINFDNVSSSDYHNKLDITCPISLESWDSARKQVLNLQLEYLQDLELSYFCLIFYYIFVTLVCLSSYFELYWIIPKDSKLQEPLIVIMSTFNLLFLSSFLLFRFFEGNKYNDSFEDLNSSLRLISDIMEDLLTMFDFFFNKQNNILTNAKKEKNSSAYGLIIKKIKINSKCYIDKQEQFQGRIYNIQEKSILRKKMIKNLNVCIKKLISSVDFDQKQYKYKFLNLIEVNFNDTLSTLIIALLTTLSTIVPKFIEFFNKQ